MYRNLTRTTKGVALRRAARDCRADTTSEVYNTDNVRRPHPGIETIANVLQHLTDFCKNLAPEMLQLFQEIREKEEEKQKQGAVKEGEEEGQKEEGAWTRRNLERSFVQRPSSTETEKCCL